MFTLFLGITPVHAEDFSVAAKHAIAVEVSTGKVLYEQDSQTPASIAREFDSLNDTKVL